MAKKKLTREQQTLASIKSFAQRLRRSGAAALRVEYDWTCYSVSRHADFPDDEAREVSAVVYSGSPHTQHKDEEHIFIRTWISQYCEQGNKENYKEQLPRGLLSAEDFVSNCLSLVSRPVLPEVQCTGNIVVNAETGEINISRWPMHVLSATHTITNL